MSESINKSSVVYVVQEIAGTKEGRPKINIIGAAQYGQLKFLLPELAQIIFSPARQPLFQSKQETLQ